jgi:hypothetical protein
MKHHKQQPVSGPIGFCVSVNPDDSRPVRRRKLRMEAFENITRMYPGEVRKVRRSMAFDSLRKKGVA